jgi:hypothetical protein
MHLLATIPADPLSGDLLWVGAALLVGFILWAAGGWILRPAVGALGLGLGALGGLLIWMETGIGPPWAAPLVGGVIVACVALLAFRLLAGGMLAAALALLAATSTWSVLHLTEDAVPPPPVAMLFGLPHQPPPASAPQQEPASGTSSDASFIPVSMPSPLSMATSKFSADERLIPFKDAWEQLPPDPRLAVLLFAGAAALAGLVCSTLFGTLGAIMLTATAGGGLILASLPRLLLNWDMLPTWLEGATGGTTLCLAWLGLTAIGLIVQGMTKPNKKTTDQGRS